MIEPMKKADIDNVTVEGTCDAAIFILLSAALKIIKANTHKIIIIKIL